MRQKSNKSEWLTAQTSAPKRCSSCGGKLPKPEYVTMPKTKELAQYHHTSEKRWLVPCLVCDIVFVWSFGNIYRPLTLITHYVRGSE